MESDYEGYIKEHMDAIRKMQEDGKTVKEIIDKGIFNLEALRRCGLPISYLQPGIEGQGMELETFDSRQSLDAKWEYWDETIFGSELARDRVLIGLLYNAGLQRLVEEILPEQSRQDLINLIKEKYM